MEYEFLLFAWQSLPPKQKDRIEVMFELFQRVEQKPNEFVVKIVSEFADENISITHDALRNAYYTIKKRQNEK